MLDGIELAQETRSNRRRLIQSTGRTIQETGVAHFSKDFEEIEKEIGRIPANTKKNNYWGPVTALFWVPFKMAVPIIRGIFSIPFGFLIGAKDAFVYTEQGNKRPRA